MKYLLDVNALVALGIRQHVFHKRVGSWVASDSVSEIATCAIIELGFIRVVSQTRPYAQTVLQSQETLRALREALTHKYTFIPDDQDADRLPRWVQYPKQITDGHLLELAKSHGAVLATLDRRIPGAYVIPD